MGSNKYSKKGGRKKKRRKTKRRLRKKRIKKTKRRRRKSSRRRYRLKGGMACANRPLQQSNMGEKYTSYKLNTNPSLPDPQSLNSNLKNVGQKGGFLMHDFGLGDVLLNYYKGMNSMANLKHTYKGNKPEVKADPMNQPKLLEKQVLPYSTANIPDHYDKASIKAAKYSIF